MIEQTMTERSRFSTVFTWMGRLWAVAVLLTAAGTVATWSPAPAEDRWISLMLAGSICLLSLVSAACYGWDKLAARWSRRRIPETTLLLLDLFGGWPGGLLARHIFRHKTFKRSYRVWFVLAVLLHSAAIWLVMWSTRLESPPVTP